MTNKEKLLLAKFAENNATSLAEKVSNDLTPTIRDQMTAEEWDDLAKKFHDWNGDPQNFFPGKHLPDFAVLHYLAFQLKQEANVQA